MKQFWYIDPKKDDKYALVGCSDWTEAYSKFEFDELGFTSDDGFYHLFAYATKFTEINKYGERNWKFEPQLIKLKVARKDYQKEDRDKNKVDVKQSRLEKWVCSLFDSLSNGIVYSGFINLQDDSMCDIFVSGTGLKGEKLDPAVLAQMMSMSASVTPLFEPPQHLDIADIKTPSSNGYYNKGGYGGGKPVQTELERLADKLAFVCEQINKCGVEPPTTSIADILRASKIHPEKELISETLSWLTTLFS